MKGNSQKHTTHLYFLKDKLVDYLKDNTLKKLFTEGSEFDDKIKRFLVLPYTSQPIGLIASKEYDKLTMHYGTDEGIKQEIIWELQD